MPASVPSRVRRTAALVLSGSAVIAASAITPAAAAPACSNVIEAVVVRDTSLVIGTKTKADLDIVAAVSTKCAVKRVDLTVGSPAGPQTFRAEKVAADADDTYWGLSVTLSAKYLANAEAGSWTTKATATSTSGAKVSKNGPKVKVLRAARVSADASPEPVRKGKTITVKGKLQRLNWETGHYAGYSGRSVDLQWRSSKGTYKTVKTVRTGAGGAATAKVKATKDGCYRFVFSGSGTTGGAKSAGDCVDVR